MVSRYEGRPSDEVADRWTFWIRHKLNLPKLFDIASDIALIVPSSCTVERLLSLFDKRYSSTQEHALEDLKATGTMLAYNRIFRGKDSL